MLYIERIGLKKRMSQVHKSILFKRPRRSTAAGSCACIYYSSCRKHRMSTIDLDKFILWRLEFPLSPSYLQLISY